MPELHTPRVPPLPESEWTDVHRDLRDRFVDGSHVDPLFATLLRVPTIVEGVMPMTRYINDASTLSPTARLLLALRTAWLDGSNAIWGAYAVRAADEHPEVIAVASGPAGDGDGDGDGDGAGLPLLRFADELVLTASVTDATWAALAAQRDVPWLMDAVETVGHVSFLCCLARSFGVLAAGYETDAPATADGAEVAAPVTVDGAGGGGRPDSPDWPSQPRPVAPRPEPRLTTARIEPLEGNDIAVLRTFARHPAMAAARAPRAGFINRVSTLTPHDRETLILRIGWDCRAEYEWAKHVGSVGHARDHGIDPALIAAGPTAPDVSSPDALLMRVADDLHQRSMVSDPTWVDLGQRYDLAAVMSAVFTASSYRSTSMSLNAYGVQLEPGDEGFPKGVR